MDLSAPANRVPDLPAPGTDEALLNLCRSQWNNSVKYHRPLYEKVQGYYNDYRGVWTGTTTPNRNNVALPYLYATVWNDVAQKVNSIFGAFPVVKFIGATADDNGIAQKNEILVSQQLEDCEAFRKSVDFFSSADIYGTGIARVGWTYLERLKRYRTTSGANVIKVVDFDGPDFQVVDILDFGPQPGKKHINDMDYCFHRYFVDYDYLLELNESYISAGYGPLFRESALAALKSMPMSNEGLDDLKARMGLYRNFGEYQARKEEPYTKPVEIVERWGLVPREFASDGVRDRVVVMANGQAILRNDGTPFWHGKKPFIACSPTPDPHYFHGIGKVAIGQKLQATAARLMNSKLDAIDLFNFPAFLADVGRIPNTENLYMRPGRIFPVEGNPAEVIQPLPVNLQGLSAVVGEIEMLNQYIQRGTGITDDTVAGLAAADRETARSAMLRHERSMTRLGLESMVISKDYVEPLANMIRDLNRQFLTLPKEVRILGTMSQINPITGFPYPTEPTPISPEDLFPDYSASAVGPMLLLTESQQRQDALQLFQLMLSNPTLLPVLNITAWVKKVLNTFKWDANEFLLTQPTVLNAAAMSGSSPEEVVSAAEGLLGGNGGQALPPIAEEEIGPQPMSQLGGY